jgi:hypothetical protein
MSTTEPDLGPVDIVVIGYPPSAPKTGEAIGLFIDLVDRGIIRVLDVAAVIKNADGTFDGFTAEADGFDEFPDLRLFEGASTGLLATDDLAAAAEALESEAAALLLVYENRWAAPFVSAVRRNGGELVAFERVPVADLLDVLASGVA